MDTRDYVFLSNSSGGEYLFFFQVLVFLFYNDEAEHNISWLVLPGMAIFIDTKDAGISGGVTNRTMVRCAHVSDKLACTPAAVHVTCHSVLTDTARARLTLATVNG